ncbi:MAG: hypothetical protein P8N51_05435 [Pseudomonadales bacterium]|nr:hypothetical protein [Pseudomonadales bacterium]
MIVTIGLNRVLFGGSSMAMSGCTINEASSSEAVLPIAKACPLIDAGGSLEMAELSQM